MRNKGPSHAVGISPTFLDAFLNIYGSLVLIIMAFPICVGLTNSAGIKRSIYLLIWKRSPFQITVTRLRIIGNFIRPTHAVNILPATRFALMLPEINSVRRQWG